MTERKSIEMLYSRRLSDESSSETKERKRTTSEPVCPLDEPEKWIPPSYTRGIPAATQIPKEKDDEMKMQRLEKSLHDFRLGILQKFWNEFETFMHEKHSEVQVELSDQRLVLCGPPNLLKGDNFLELFLQASLCKELTVLRNEDVVDFVSKKSPKGYIDRVLFDHQISCFWGKCPENGCCVQVFAKTQSEAANAADKISLCVFRLELVLALQDEFLTFMKDEFPTIDVTLGLDRCPVVMDNKCLVTDMYIELFICQLSQEIYQFSTSLYADFVCRQSSKDHFHRNLKKRQIKCFWCKEPYCELDTNSIKIYAQTQEDAKKALQIMNNSLKEYTKVVTADERKFLDKKLNTEFAHESEKQYVFRVREENTPNMYKYSIVALEKAAPTVEKCLEEMTKGEEFSSHQEEPIQVPQINIPKSADERLQIPRSKSVGQSYKERKLSAKSKRQARPLTMAVPQVQTETFKERLVWKGDDFPFQMAEENLKGCNTSTTNGFVCESTLKLEDRVLARLQKDGKNILIQKGNISDSAAQLIMCPVNRELKEFGIGETIIHEGDRRLLQDGLLSIRVKEGQEKKHQFGSCFSSDVTGSLACSELFYTVLPDGLVEQTSQSSKLITQSVLKMMDHAEKKCYTTLAICVDYMDTDSEEINKNLARFFMKAIKNSKFLQGTIFQGTLKNVQEIHLIGRNDFMVDCLLMNVQQVLKQRTKWTIRMFDSQFDVRDEQLLKSPIVMKTFEGSVTDDRLIKDTDMLVNSIDPACTGRGGFVNRNVFNAAGQQIRDELKQNYPELLKPGEVAVTSPGKLSCSKICHGLLYQQWDNVNHISVKLVRSVVIKSLKEADKHGCATVTFPALGTGTLNYPWHRLAKTMFESVDQYGKCNPGTCVKTVIFALFSSDQPSQQAFKIVFDRWRVFPNCSNFSAQEHVLQSDWNKPEPFGESLETRGLGAFRVIPLHLIGVCFHVDIIFTFKFKDSFEDSTEKNTPQRAVQEEWRFDMCKNVYDVPVELDRSASSSNRVMVQAVKTCLLAMDIHRFTALAIHIQETDVGDIVKQIELLTKIFMEQQREKFLLVYFIVDKENITSVVTPLGSSQLRGLEWKLKHRALKNHIMPAVEISLTADSKKNLQQATDQIQHWKNEQKNKSVGHTSGSSLSTSSVAASQQSEGAIIEEEALLQLDPAEEEQVLELHVCCFEGNLEKVKILMQNLSSDELNIPDSEGDTALHCCAHWQNADIMKVLLERSDIKLNELNENQMTPLEVSMLEDDVECAELLVQRGCDVNIQDSNGDTLIHRGIRDSSSEILKVILMAPSADFTKENKKELNALMWATLLNNSTAVDLILDRDKKLVNIQTKEGYTPVHAVATNNYMEVASILLNKGEVDRSLVDNARKTPLHIAVYQGFESMIDLLVGKGYDVNAQDCNGDTPLHIAQYCSMDDMNKSKNAEDRYIRDRRNTARILCRLIEHRAQIHIKNNKGKTPLEAITDHVTQQFVITLAATVKASVQPLSSGGITLPCHWLPMEGKPYRKIPLTDKLGLTQLEYRDIEALFMESFRSAKILSVSRVQNPYLWEHFMLKKLNMERMYGRGCANEKELFHGTQHRNIERICEENLDFRRANERTGALLGSGSYFALESHNSDLYCPPRKDGRKSMMVMRVLVGKVCKGNPSYSKPPLINPEDADSRRCYDACVDSVDNPKVFCLFETNQYYPDYVVEYSV